MKLYTIKYEDYDGDVRVIEITGFSKKHALDQLVDCKVVYWIE